MSPDPLASLELPEALQKAAASGATTEALLQSVLRHFDCQAGTVHFLDEETGLLALAASSGIPDIVLEKIVRIPVGKGMGGLAAERREPVQVCNLQTDESGVARSGAKATHMEGSISAPMLVNAELAGVLGIAKPIPHEWTRAECDLLMQAAAEIGAHHRRVPV